MKFLSKSGKRKYPRTPQHLVLDLKTGKQIKQSIYSKPSHDVTIVIPAFKEESRLSPMLVESINYLEKRFEGSLRSEVIVVDDGSPDGTSSCVQKVFEELRPANADVGLIRFPVNQGKGAAISEVRFYFRALLY